MSKEHFDYCESLRTKINNWLVSPSGKTNAWAKYIRYTPDLFHLLVKLSGDKQISVTSKAKLAAAISYFVSPLDLIPEEFWGALGYVDDIAFAALVLKDIIKNDDPQIIQNHWEPEEELIPLIEEILNVAEQMVGKKWWQKILELVEK
jgi:uncharacterized membrane protein YkvA (DUF1232 family)